MSFIRTKDHGGRDYRYLVENYREGGKVKQRVLKYLGPVDPKREPPTPYRVDYVMGRGLTHGMGGYTHPAFWRRDSSPDAGSEIYLPEIYDIIRWLGDTFHVPYRESDLIQAIVETDIHEALHSLIAFKHDKRDVKAHRAIDALLGDFLRERFGASPEARGRYVKETYPTPELPKPPTVCTYPGCETPISQPKTGRPRIYCSSRCRDAARRLRAKGNR